MSKTLLWTPIDFPQFTKDQKDSFFTNYKKDYLGVTASAMESQMFTTRLTENRYSVSEFNESYRETHGFLFDFVDKHLPFDQIINIKIHRQYRDASSIHIDFAKPDENPLLFENNKVTDPCGYRMVIAGSRQGALHVENSSGERIYPLLPETTDWYCIGSTNVRHAVQKLDEGRMIIFTHGWINAEKHKEIIDRSLEKYSDYAVWDS